MRKGVLSIVVIVVVAIVGLAPYAMGVLTKRSIEKALPLMSYPPFYQVKIKTYKMGWMESNVTFEVESMLPYSERAALQLAHGNRSSGKERTIALIKGHIQHGPIIWITNHKTSSVDWYFGRGAMYTNLVLPNKVSKKILRELKQLPQIHATTYFSYGGAYDWHFAVEPINYSEKTNGLLFDWQGIKGRWQVGSNTNKMDLTIGVLPIKVSDKSNNLFNFSGANLTANINRNNAYHLWMGDNKLNIGNINISERGRQLLQLGNMTLQGTNSLNNDLAQFDGKYNLQKLAIIGQSYAPTSLSINMENFDAKALGDMVKISEEMNKNFFNRQKQQQLAIQLIPKVIEAFSRGVKVAVNADITTPQGKVTGNANIALAKPSVPGIGGLETMIQNANISVNLTVPKSLVTFFWTKEEYRRLVRQARYQAARNASSGTATQQPNPLQLHAKAQSNVDQMLNQFQSQKFIVIDGDMIKFHATYQNKQLKLNNTAFPLMKLFR